MRLIKIIMSLVAAGFVIYEIYDYYDTSQQNEVAELNNQIVDELIDLQDYVGEFESRILGIFDPEIEITPARFMMLDLLKGAWKNPFSAARHKLDAIVLPDTPEAEALRAEGHKVIAAFAAMMVEYDELITLIVVKEANYEDLYVHVNNTIYELNVEQQAVVDAFTAVQDAYLAN